MWIKKIYVKILEGKKSTKKYWKNSCVWLAVNGDLCEERKEKKKQQLELLYMNCELKWK